jgi:hypothetical protein
LWTWKDIQVALNLNSGDDGDPDSGGDGGGGGGGGSDWDNIGPALVPSVATACLAGPSQTLHAT